MRWSPERDKQVACVSDIDTELTRIVGNLRRSALHRPGKPQQDAFIESFYRCLRDGLANEILFGSLTHARVALARWKLDQNISGLGEPGVEWFFWVALLELTMVSFLGYGALRLTDKEARGRAFRRRRFQLFLRLVDQVLSRHGICRILDIGGEPEYWTNVADMLDKRDLHVTLVNLTTSLVVDPSFTSLVGDARDLSSFADMSFNLVHSNSVIEHVGRWQDMQAMAREVRRLAPSYFVQTPYFWFPVEPHCATAFFHWLPESMRVSMLMRRPRWHWGQAPDIDTAMRQIQSVALLDYRMLATLFPDATIYRERFLGLTKSLIAVRDGI